MMNLSTRLLSLTLLLSGLTDLLRIISLGPITALGVLTIFLSLASWILVLTRSKIPKVVLIASALVLFIISAIMNWLWHYSVVSPVTVIQNLSVYVAFVGFILLSTIKSYQTFDLPNYINRILPKAIQISVVIFALGLITVGPGSKFLMGSRSFALFALIGVAWFLAVWRYRLPGGIWWAGFTILTIALSLSRTALLIAFILFPLSQISLTSLKGWLKIALTTILIITVAYLAFTYVEPIKSRFTDLGDNATLGGLQINTSGRGTAWPIAYASALESPWIGKGPGSVGMMLSQSVGPAFSHPHNDYLRIFHDYGLIGLTFWFVGYVQLIIKTWQNWQWADRYDRENAHLHLAAFLGLLGVALGMTTDNVVVYIFAMAPLGILVGASLGNGSRRQKVIKSDSEFTLISGSLEQVAIKP